MGGLLGSVDGAVLLPAVGLLMLFVITRSTETNGSERYIVPAFGCWLGLELLLVVAQQTGVVPRPLGLAAAVLLLVGFCGLFCLGLAVAVRARDPFLSG